MGPDDVKKIRVELELTQEELATILGITKASVIRYESVDPKKYSPPQGDTAHKLNVLENLLKNPKDRTDLQELRKEKGGIANIGSLITMGAILFPAPILGALFLANILGAPSVKSLIKFFQKDRKDNS